MTESLLFDGQVLCSTNLDSYGRDLYDIKGVLMAENEHVSVIHKLLVRFPQPEPALLNQVDFPAAKDGSDLLDFFALLKQHTAAWKAGFRRTRRWCMSFAICGSGR